MDGTRCAVKPFRKLRNGDQGRHRSYDWGGKTPLKNRNKFEPATVVKKIVGKWKKGRYKKMIEEGEGAPST